MQVGTLYDQNHNDNHRNSMAGQSLLIELEQGDRVQVRDDRQIISELHISHFLPVLKKIWVVVWLFVCHAGIEIRAFGQNSQQLFQFYTKHSFEHLESTKLSNEFV